MYGYNSYAVALARGDGLLAQFVVPRFDKIAYVAAARLQIFVSVVEERVYIGLFALYCAKLEEYKQLFDKLVYGALGKQFALLDECRGQQCVVVVCKAEECVVVDGALLYNLVVQRYKLDAVYAVVRRKNIAHCCNERVQGQRRG